MKVSVIGCLDKVTPLVGDNAERKKVVNNEEVVRCKDEEGAVAR